MAGQLGIGTVVLCAAITGCAIGQKQTSDQAGDSATGAKSEIKDLKFSIKTTKGDIEGTIFASKTPVTAANFCNLVSQKYYDGIIFHRVIADFMIQVGDPLTKKPGTEPAWGTGGPGYRFEDEFRRELRHSKPGILSMANAGAGTNGSQIFITHVPTPHLDGKHTVFGAVTKGQDIVNKIQKGDKIVSAKIEGDTGPLFKAYADRIAEWNKTLKKGGYISDGKKE